MILPVQIIEKKKAGQALSPSDIKEFFTGYLQKQVEDYQVSALLMAICLLGMNDEETAELTHLIAKSGHFFTWPGNPERYVDKHSTGGVGDKTSLVLLPLLTLLGAKVPMISGRGLGHTGGTLDKLESIPGMRVFFTPDEIMDQMKKQGGIFMGQSENIAPLDKRLYSLRDVTGTVGSVPLICSSILGKKISEGISGLVMDVKCGSGAMLTDKEKTRDLAKAISKVAKAAGLRVKAFLTDMNSPLGFYSGNRLEVLECIQIMQGEGPQDTRALCERLAWEMAKLALPEESEAHLLSKMRKLIASGEVFEQFCRIVKIQGGDAGLLFKKEFWQQAKIKRPLFPKEAGYIARIDVTKLGVAIITLGGGRRIVTDRVDFDVGLAQTARVGAYVDQKTPLLVIHGNDESRVQKAEELLRSAYTLSQTKVPENPLIEEEIV